MLKDKDKLLNKGWEKIGNDGVIEYLAKENEHGDILYITLHDGKMIKPAESIRKDLLMLLFRFILERDPIRSIKMQIMYNEKKNATQTQKERLEEIQNKILSFQKRYKKLTSAEAFVDIDVDSIDNPYDYWEWQDLEGELMKIIRREYNENQDEL